MFRNVIQQVVRRQVWAVKRRTVIQVLTPRCRRDGEPEYGRFTRQDSERIIRQARTNLTGLLPFFKDLPNLGNYMMVYSAMVDLACYRALMAEDVERQYAIRLIGDINWLYVIQTSGYYRLKKKLIAVRTRDPIERMGLFLRDTLKFPYGEPGYKADLTRDGDVYRMNFYSCPLYDFFKQFGEEELTLFRKVFCTYDYAAAERLIEGGRYERDHTLSEGDYVCDMRWFIVEPEAR